MLTAADIYPNMVVPNFGFWEMPKMGGPEKGGFQDHQK